MKQVVANSQLQVHEMGCKAACSVLAAAGRLSRWMLHLYSPTRETG
jgi:hypothetical protein